MMPRFPKAPESYSPVIPPPPARSHVHRWQPAGVVESIAGISGLAHDPRSATSWWVAQSCECGAVRAVPLTVEEKG